MQQYQTLFKTLLSLPPALIGAVLNLIAQVIEGVEKVLTSGSTETIDLRVTLFGRRLGIKAEIALLDKVAP